MSRTPYICPLLFIEFQLQHYSERLNETKKDEERWFLRKELFNLKQAYQTYYN